MSHTKLYRLMTEGRLSAEELAEILNAFNAADRAKSKLYRFLTLLQGMCVGGLITLWASQW